MPIIIIMAIGMDMSGVYIAIILVIAGRGLFTVNVTRLDLDHGGVSEIGIIIIAAMTSVIIIRF